MSKKKLRAKEPMVPQAMRRAVVDNRPLISRLLGLDAGMDNDEFCAEILRLCLFDRRERKNPHAIFQDRLNNGDFLPIQPGEDPGNLRPGREPMSDEMLDEAVAKASADGAYWNGNRCAPVIDIVRSVMLTA